MLNQDLEKFFKDNGIQKGIGKKLPGCDVILTDKEDIPGKGIFCVSTVKDGKEQYYKYLIPDQSLVYNYEDYISKYGVEDYSTFDVLIGHDVYQDKPVKVNMIERIHSAVLGKSGSGKSVELKFLLAQFLQNPFTEFYIIDKGDFDILKGTEKVVFKSKTDAMAGAEFFSFIQYFWLMANDRMRFFTSLGCNEWRDYKKKFMGTDPKYPLINYSIVIIDEYQTLRSSMADTIGLDVFDRKMKMILDYVRSAGIIFYFGTQDLKVDLVGNIRDVWANIILGSMGYIQAGSVDSFAQKNLLNKVSGTYMFYDRWTGSYLKIPFSPRMNEILVEESNDPKNRMKENKKYSRSFEMLNEILDTLDSDIFSVVDDLVEFLGIDPELVSKLKRTNSYASFIVLCFTIVRAIKNNLINSTFDIFQPVIFQKPTDTELFDYIFFYKENKNFVKALTETFENSADREAFMEHLNYVLTNHLKTIVADTQLDFGKKKNVNENTIPSETTFTGQENISHNNIVESIHHNEEVSYTNWENNQHLSTKEIESVNVNNNTQNESLNSTANQVNIEQQPATRPVVSYDAYTIKAANEAEISEEENEEHDEEWVAETDGMQLDDLISSMQEAFSQQDMAEAQKKTLN